MNQYVQLDIIMILSDFFFPIFKVTLIILLLSNDIEMNSCMQVSGQTVKALQK